MASDGETLFYANTYNLNILRLDCQTNLASCAWTELEQKRSIVKYSALALLVPDHLTECSCKSGLTGNNCEKSTLKRLRPSL